MAEIDAKPDFGIQNTMDTSGAGDQTLIDNLLSPDTSTASPAGVTAIEEGAAATADGKGPDGKADATELAGKEDGDVPASKATNPDSLTNFLLGGGDDDEEEEEEGKGKEKGKGSPTTVGETTTETPAPDGKENKNNEGDGGGDESNIAFDNLANELADLGVFNRMEDEADGIKITTPEDFLSRFKQEKEMAANQMISDFIGQFGQEHQDAFQAIYVNGANPRDYFSQQAKIENFENIDISKEQNQERVVRQTLTDQGFEPEDVDKEIEKLKNYGDLEDVSKRHHKVLVKKEKASLTQKAEEAKQVTQLKQAQKAKYVENVRSVLQEKIKAKDFDGIPVNIKTANELQDFLLVDKWKTESGETLTDFDKSILDLKLPENHEQKVKIALLLKLLEKDPTLSTIQKRGVSKESRQLFKDVAKQQTVAKRVTANKKQPAKSWFQH